MSLGGQWRRRRVLEQARAQRHASGQAEVEAAQTWVHDGHHQHIQGLVCAGQPEVVPHLPGRAKHGAQRVLQERSRLGMARSTPWRGDHMPC